MNEENDNALNALKKVIKRFTDPRLKGKKLTTKPGWHALSDSGEYDILLSIFDNRAIIVFVSGNVTSEFAQNMSDILTDILSKKEFERLPFIADVRGVTKISWTARKILRAMYDSLKSQFGHVYYIISPNLKGYFKIYHTFFPARKKHTTFVSSMEEGLLLHLNQDDSDNLTDDSIPKNRILINYQKKGLLLFTGKKMKITFLSKKDNRNF